MLDSNRRAVAEMTSLCLASRSLVIISLVNVEFDCELQTSWVNYGVNSHQLSSTMSRDWCQRDWQRTPPVPCPSGTREGEGDINMFVSTMV